MNYDQTVAYLYALLPSFQDNGGDALNYKLDKISLLLEAVGNPHEKLKCIHVGGTNGKGTTSHIIATCLSESGYKVGLYTSPHLKSFTERIKVSEQEIEKTFVVDFVAQFGEELKRFQPSFFEMTVLLAFYYFAYKDIEVAVIEVGLGGRFDATNVINPVCSVITNISLDHQEFLGDEIGTIAFEKAGIIKQGVPVVIGEYHSESLSVFEKQALLCGAKLIKAFETKIPEEYIDGDDVDYIQLNKRTAFATLEEVSSLFNLPQSKMEGAFKNYAEIWGLKGRWQKIGQKPLVYCDTGHNTAAIALLMNRLNQLSCPIHIVWGMAKDKDIEAVLKLLQKEARYYFCQSNNGRGLNAHELCEKANALGLKGVVYKSVQEALNEAKRKAQETDFILVGGSTFVVAEIEAL